MKKNRSGFTLIEILVACILLGIGATSVIGLLLISLQRARMVTAMTTMGPMATSAANLCVIHNQIPAAGSSDFIILPDSTSPPTSGVRPNFTFNSPFAFRIDRAPDTSNGNPTSGSYNPGSPLLDTGSFGTDDTELITLRIRVYDNPAHRDSDIRCLGTMFIRAYQRVRP